MSNKDLVQIDKGNVVELVDPNEPEREQLKLELEQVKASLFDLVSTNEQNIKDLSDLAKAGRHHLIYAALAAMVKAQNETHQTLSNTLKQKQELMDRDRTGNQPVGGQNVTNNNLVVTSTDILDEILKRKSNI